MLQSSSPASRGRRQASKTPALVCGSCSACAVPTLAKWPVAAAHDVDYGVAELVDPKLTPKGCAEAQAVSDWSAANLGDNAEAVFVSPM